jgi:hypothetical protein
MPPTIDAELWPGLTWLRLFHDEWERINRDALDGRLRPPAFAIDDSTTRLGAWDRAGRTIHFSASHLENDTMAEIEETLRHEMAHQVVDELYSAASAQPHGELFARACRQLRIAGSARLRGAIDGEARRVLEKIRKLTRLAASSNPHEAQLAAATANRLQLAYNLRVDPTSCDYGYQRLGKPMGVISSEAKVLAGILSEFYFVRAIWLRTWLPGSQGRAVVLEAVGRAHDLAIADYTFGYLQRALDSLWRSYSRTLPPAARARARRSFRVGVAVGFREQLAAQRQRSAGEGLVWLGDPAIAELYDARHPRRRAVSGGRYRDDAAFAEGKSAGLDLQVRAGVEDASGAARGRLLE